ncbi:hypothetical protein L3V77_24160 [Vibrio sp. DW001]|uniref:hypothetical protein n=1 Tax=Vibrio sp. DW001 TaxID=2912315 RepID=UPI0023B19E1D|nr:hypothetical protein [Vibrio sp. DW001]WED29030.1 hypothetical protein L3V77_24160 [Vibrio sp. DW001]
MPLKQKDIFLQALELIIDGVALSTPVENRASVGVYLMSLVISDTKGQLDADKIKAMMSIIELADEADSPAFKL